jgi:hypothetical protein
VRPYWSVYTSHDSCFANSDHIEGEALIAEKNAHAYDDGVVDKNEKKALDAAHKKQLHNRHRGVAQYRPYRTAIWMKEGIKKRVLPKKKSSKRERECHNCPCSELVLTIHCSRGEV